MTRAPATLRESDSVTEAAAKLLSQHHPGLPVVDSRDRYLGMFGIDDLLGLIVPRVALAGNPISNLRFVGDDADQLRRNFDAVKDRHVSEFANRNCATLEPDMPQVEAIRLFCRSHGALPVVEKGTRKVLGMVSHSDALRALVGIAGA